MPSNIVADVVNFYYKHVQKKLTSAEHLAVSVPNLGTFEIQKRRMISKMEKSKNYLAKTEGDTASMAVFSNRIQFKKDIEKFEKLLGKLEEQDLEKQQVRIEKENYKKNKQ